MPLWVCEFRRVSCPGLRVIEALTPELLKIIKRTRGELGIPGNVPETVDIRVLNLHPIKEAD